MKTSVCILSIVYCMHGIAGQISFGPKNFLSVNMIMNTTEGIIKDGNRRYSLINYIKQRIHECAAFEIGYITYIIQDKYRKMVDKYNTSVTMNKRLYLMELVMTLEEIERLYWELDHIYSMMHEIERKYKIPDGSATAVDYLETTTRPSYEQYTTMYGPTRREKVKKLRRDEKERFRNRLKALQFGTTRKESTRWWWPLDYGWEIDYYW